MDAALLQDAIRTNLLAAAVAQAAPVHIWLDVSDREPPPTLLDRLAAIPGVMDVQAAWDRYNALLREPLPAAVGGMIYAGFWVSLLLSVLDFGFYLSVTARRRALGFAVLRALGWRADRLWLHIALEQGALVLPALVVGIGLGAVMAYVILPFLALIGGAALTLPMSSLLILLAVLLGGFGALTLGAAWWLRRLNINQTLRLGEE
jgi:ABC-type antimicrobial peptide transport system permease subunit